ncbi:MAG: response regulator transcription factor [Actinomycetota bacterium]|nr:response regulator transcription factor [Actinomycetota bacterium]
MLRVALCDDHGVVRSGLRRILDAEVDLEVVGDAGSVDEAITLARREQPDVFIMDLGLPDGSGITATAEVRRVSPNTRVLVLTVHDDVAYLRRAFEAGADGYMVKEAADVELVRAVRQVASGRQYVHPTLGAALLAADAPHARPHGPGGDLSEREVEVLRGIALGMTNSEIAAQLFVSVRTVETHRAHIQQKLNIRSRADFVRFARDTGLLDEESPE